MKKYLKILLLLMAIMPPVFLLATVEEKSHCDASPVGLNALNIRAHSAMLTWASNGSAEYQVYVSETKGAPAADYVTLMNPFKLLNGLQPATTYYFYVRYDCFFGNVSAWSESSFTTRCEPVTELTGNFKSWITGTVHTHNRACCTTTCSAAAEINSSTILDVSYANVVNATFLTTPEFASEVDFTQKQLSFSLTGNTDQIALHVGIIEAPGDMSSYQEIQTILVKNVDTIEQIVIPLEAYTGPGRYIVLSVNANEFWQQPVFRIENVELQLLDEL
jgi:hypothetical protein